MSSNVIKLQPTNLPDKLWKIKSGRGAPVRVFKTAQDLWDTACNYFQWVDTHPLYRYEQRKGTVIAVGKKQPVDTFVAIPLPRPYTKEGLCVFAGCALKYFSNIKHNIFEDLYKEDLDLLNVIEHIENIIHTQKYEGAAVGIFNPVLISRDLGLRDTVQLTTPPDESFNVTLDLK